MPVSNSNLLRITLLGVVVFGLLAGPYWADRGTMRLLIEAFYFLALAQLWNLLAGYSGLISVGQQAFVGLGGYMLFTLTMFAGLPVLVALPLAGVFTGILAFPTAIVAFRLSGPYFAIGTWVIAEVFRLGFAQISSLGGGSGISLPTNVVRDMADGRAARESLTYWIALAIMLVVIFGIWFLMRSRVGLGLGAIRDNEEAATSVGVQTNRLKFSVFVGVAAMTGMIGALIFLQKLRITPEAAFSVNDWSVLVIFIVVIGGIGTLEGPIIGCILFFVLREFLADIGSWYMIILGLISVAIMLLEPRGLWGLLTQNRNLTLFPTTRQIDHSP
ncbi:MULTISPECIES: branched-chain amino acid ABC transporter permease [unclassified Sulfitobacter]|uniref:branched-chain amino acid ABC transporter permease n=1 Tax=unclassified Sulfitobacter TaxID=196795 RepID=UPI0005627BEC|nr:MULTISPECIES: branched-chain amino acid ABC transporter permease [unclassified Sulfitobacter]PTA97701.1 branched-chain amino acid ABC transporter permease [Sulfitobacter sp. CB-A]ULO22214.1 branched-chain amino acid ABC transporter permease [Sulfitobacter sp. CB2047]